MNNCNFSLAIFLYIYQKIKVSFYLKEKGLLVLKMDISSIGICKEAK